MEHPARGTAGLLIALAVAMFASPAWAIDGAVRINQARAERGDITPGDAPGFPITLSQRGDYKLTGNLVVPAGDGEFPIHAIVVEEHDVTIDLNGFTISGTTDPFASGIVGYFVDSVTVRNGTIRGFGWAVELPSAAYSVIENMRLIGNGVGIGLGDHGRVLRNTVAENHRGISCRIGCVVSGNVVSGTAPEPPGLGGSGIDLRAGIVQGNLVTHNGFAGIVTGNGSDGPTAVGNNTLYGNSIDNGGGPQMSGAGIAPLHPNQCVPAC